jgi:hypothetical protein
MKELVFFLEEPSAQAMLQGLLPRMLAPDIHVRLIPFEGKQDLEKQLTRRLRGYLNPQARFIVLRDQDSAPDCTVVKRKLLALCADAGREAVSLVRVACRELETIYLADLAAVERAMGLTGLRKQQGSARFRQPDHLGNPSEELAKLTRGAYQKLGASRLIGPQLDLDNERSPTFKNLVKGIKRLEAELLALPAEAS